MSHEDWPGEPTEMLIIQLGKCVIESAEDCQLLYDEIESIAEDYPGNVVVFQL